MYVCYKLLIPRALPYGQAHHVTQRKKSTHLIEIDFGGKERKGKATRKVKDHFRDLGNSKGNNAVVSPPPGWVFVSLRFSG